MTRTFAMIAALAALTGPASADEAIPTAGGGSAAPAARGAAAPILIPDHDAFDHDVVRSVGPCGGLAKADGKPDKNPHGEVFAGVGTHGYREGGGVVCMPLGDHAAATIAVDVGRTDGRGWRR